MMKLYHSFASPFVRKVLVTAIECGLKDEIEIVTSNPLDSESVLIGANPLSRVPALSLEDGTTLINSPLLCEYLIDRAGRFDLLPREGAERWKILRWQALADGVMETAVPRSLERRRPEQEQSPHWIDRWATNIARTLDTLEEEIGDLPEGPTLAHIAIACALGYLQFRHPDIDWREGRPRLTAWEAQFDERPAMVETRHRT